MIGLDPVIQDWLGVDVIFGVDDILNYHLKQKSALRFISQFKAKHNLRQLLQHKS